MNKIKTQLKRLFFIAIVPLLAAGCNKDLQDDMNDLKDRVTSLEATTAKLQEAIDAGKLITSVAPFDAAAGNPSGWTITFSDKSTIPVYNGQKGDTGAQGNTGIQGPKGDTPYIWINGAGNWAVNPVAKPADSDDVKYELKVDGKSVKAYGTSTRTKNIDGYVGFEEYDAVSGVVKNTVKTTIPFDHKNYITSIVETDESVTMTIDGKPYTMLKPLVLPASISVLSEKGYIIKGDYISFYIAVNPATCKEYPAEAFSLYWEDAYFMTRAYGVQPEFLSIESVIPEWDSEEPEDVMYRGQYEVTLKWEGEENAEDAYASFENAAIFIVLNSKDQKGELSQVVSSTPIIVSEKFVSIEDENVSDLPSVVMFSDETYTASVLLDEYHPGYVDEVAFEATSKPTTAPVVTNRIARYLNATPMNKYKFTLVPYGATNATVWTNGVYWRADKIAVTVTDWGRPAVPGTPADPSIGRPATPGVPELLPEEVEKDFQVTVYKAPADGVIYRHDFKEYWIPNKIVEYKPSVALGAEFGKNGYGVSEWNFAIKSQTLKKGAAAIAMTNNVTADVEKFTAANNYVVAYKLLPTIDAGSYSVELVVTATPKTPRPAELKQSRDFTVIMTFKVVPPSFMINIKGGHTLIGNDSDTYHTYKLAAVNVADILDAESTKNISKATDLTPNATPLGYEFDLTDPRHGAQGVRFNPYPAVAAPAIADWGSLTYIKKPVTVVVKLETGQEIPVQIMCTDAAGSLHATGKFFVQYDRLDLHHVNAVNVRFTGNYNLMVSTGINVAAGSNFTPKSVADVTLDPTMIKTPGGIVFSEVGTVQCQGGALPSGLAGKKVLSIDASTGLVKSVDGMTWENPDAVLYQTFRVTYTDIWGGTATKDVNVFFKSNGVPAI